MKETVTFLATEKSHWFVVNLKVTSYCSSFNWQHCCLVCVIKEHEGINLANVRRRWQFYL